MSKMTNKFSPEVRGRAVRMVQSTGLITDRMGSDEVIAAKVGCSLETLRRW